MKKRIVYKLERVVKDAQAAKADDDYDPKKCRALISQLALPGLTGKERLSIYRKLFLMYEGLLD
jgi:hypothetical protein